MLDKKMLTKFRSELGINQLIENMLTTASKVAAIRRDLAELNRRVRDREADLADIELPFLEETSSHGRNSTLRKIMFQKLCRDSGLWQDARKAVDDAVFHRDMRQAELSGSTARLGAQQHASNLIAATLHACSE